MKKFFGLLLAAVMTFSLVACGAQNVPSDNTSDDYPSGPITCIVPYAAGGGSDVLTRTIMKYISLPNNVNMVAVNVEGLYWLPAGREIGSGRLHYPCAQPHGRGGLHVERLHHRGPL